MSPKRELTYRRFAPRAQHKFAGSELYSQIKREGFLPPVAAPLPLPLPY